MENVSTFTVAELLQRRRPFTAASSATPNPNRTPSPSSSSNCNNSDPNPNPSHKILTPLDQFAVLVGTLTLPTATAAASATSSNLTPRCPYNTCFQFSDGSASICCDVLDFDVGILRNPIKILAFNFVPFKRTGGFLEIIRWSFIDSNGGSKFSSISMSLGSSIGQKDNSKAQSRVFGLLELVSPVFSVGDSGSTKVPGFLLQMMVCECKFCSSNASVHENDDAHCFTKQLFVYGCGSASSWHPVFTKLVGNVVAISGMKKKFVYIGKNESELVYVPTGKSALKVFRFSRKWLRKCGVVTKGKGECGTYRGIVKGVYMQGMVVELDNEVWLLLTDQLLTPPHSLRAGALVSVRNVHFVNPRFSWTKMLLLGACFRTSVIVESFSPFETGCHVLSQSPSSLGKFVESLVFSARLWVLLVASCFRKKFAGTLSEKEILGTKHTGGLVQMYASSHFPSSMHQTRHGVFTELCKHDSCGCGCQPYISDLKLVVPLSVFICHYEALWMRAMQLENNCGKLHHDKIYNLQLCEGRSHVQSVRKVFSSEDIGVSLIGNLKTSPSSGRLQLVDATGSIDVLLPDLPSTWDTNRIYKVVDYSLVIEGMPRSGYCIGLLDNQLLSCRTIFHFTSLARKMNLTVYIYFRLRNSLCRNLPFYPYTEMGEDLKILESGMFHLLLVSHKFPVLQKFRGDVVIANTSSMFVEAIILPWNLFLAGRDGNSYPTTVLRDDPENSIEPQSGGNCLEHISLKRRKVNHSPSRGLNSSLMDMSFESVTELSSCSTSHVDAGQRNSDLSSREISCSVMISGVNSQSLVGSVILHSTGTKLSKCGFCKPSGQKVLLEFTSKSFAKYQWLQIGGYYITKHDREDSVCNLKNASYSSGDNILIPSTTHLWSFSFTSEKVCQNNGSSKCLPLHSSLGTDKVLSEDHNEVLPSEDHNEVLLQMAPENASGNSSDISLCLPENVVGFGEVILKELEEDLIKPVVTPPGIPKISSCIGAVMTAPQLSFDSNCLFPEGKLLSFCGHVVAVHSVEDNSVDPYYRLRFLQNTTSSCIHVLMDNQIVRLSVSSSNHAFPAGFGPGVDATFYRVLELREQKRWMLTSVSFIVINSIRAVCFNKDSIRTVNESCGDKCSSPVSYMQNAMPLDFVSSGLISELVQCLDVNPMRFHCRVVAIRILVLEKKLGNGNCQPRNHSRPYLVDIPLAGFVLDDGSSPCYCWANSERAAILLRLYEEFPLSAFECSGWALKWAGTHNDACSATISHLERILKSHDRITVENFGPMFDSSHQDLMVSVGSGKPLSSYDENLLKFIIFNACFSKIWTIVGNTMDSNAVTRLKTENLLETEMSMHSTQHMWAREVHYTNPLVEARNVVQELLDD